MVGSVANSGNSAFNDISESRLRKEQKATRAGIFCRWCVLDASLIFFVPIDFTAKNKKDASESSEKGGKSKDSAKTRKKSKH